MLLVGKMLQTVKTSAFGLVVSNCVKLIMKYKNIYIYIFFLPKGYNMKIIKLLCSEVHNIVTKKTVSHY